MVAAVWYTEDNAVKLRVTSQVGDIKFCARAPQEAERWTSWPARDMLDQYVVDQMR